MLNKTSLKKLLSGSNGIICEKYFVKAFYKSKKVYYNINCIINIWEVYTLLYSLWTMNNYKKFRSTDVTL